MVWKKPNEELSQFLDEKISIFNVVLPDSIYNDPEKFQDWLNRSYLYVSSLPSKKVKPG